MKIKSLNINKSQYQFNIVSYISDGRMSKEDKQKLDRLSDMSLNDTKISSINITGASKEECSEYFSQINSDLSEHTERIDNLSTTISNVLPNYCGRVWDESNSTPVAKTYCGNLTMLQHLPEILGLGGYLVKNDHTRRKLSSKNHYFFETGEEAKLDGSMGHYQWGWNRPFYITTWTDGDLFYECISLEPIKGRESYYVPVGSMSAAGVAALDRETNTLVSYINNSPRYRGGNNTAKYDNDTNKTLLGKSISYLNPEKFAEAAHKNGKGWYAGTMRMNAVLQVLFHIIMGTRNSQTVFNPVKNSNGLYSCGVGLGAIYNLFNNNWAVWQNYNDGNPFINLNEYVDKGDYLGESEVKEITFINSSNKEQTDTYKIPIFFGLKNIFGYLWTVSEDDFAYHNSDNLYTHYIRKSMYDDNYQFAIINNSVIQGSTSIINMKYIKKLSYEHLEMWPIQTVDNNVSSNIYYCDYAYSITYSTTDLCLSIQRGGSSTNNPYMIGLSLLNITSSISYTAANTSSYLCEFTEDFLLEPVVI